MAGNKFQIKRTGVSGRLPNTTDQGNSAFIDVGELAFNFSDGILYSSDGNNAIEIGANVTNQNITGTLTANGSVGANGQVLFSNSNGIFWGDIEAAGGLISVISDDTLEGDGTNETPLGIFFARINVGTRQSTEIPAKLTRLLEFYFRFDESFRNATVFTRTDRVSVIPS